VDTDFTNKEYEYEFQIVVLSGLSLFVLSQVSLLSLNLARSFCYRWF